MAKYLENFILIPNYSNMLNKYYHKHAQKKKWEGSSLWWNFRIIHGAFLQFTSVCLVSKIIYPPRLYHIRRKKKNLHEKAISLNFCAPSQSLLHTNTPPKRSFSMNESHFFLCCHKLSIQIWKMY